MTVADTLRSTLVYEANSVASQLDADIQEMREFDRENEKQESFWGWIGFGGVMLTIVSIVGSIFLADSSMLPLGLGGIAVGVITAIVGFIIRSRFGKFNLDDMRYLFLGKIVQLLKTDMREEDPFQVNLSFRRHNDKQNFDRKGVSGPWKVKFFVHPWITISGRLLDGARFTISLTEKQQDRYKTKRSASGKTKTKYKTKNSGEALVVLRFKEKRYPQFGQNRQAMIDAVQLPEGVELKTLDVTSESIKIQAKSAFADGGDDEQRAAMQVRLTTAMLLSCYHILNQSRRAAG